MVARPRQTSDDDILEAARACFLRRGASVSTSEIAKSIGVSQSVLFQRFGTKEELLLRALVPTDPPAWLATVEAGPDARPLREQLEEMAEGISAFMREMQPLFAVLRTSGIDPASLIERFHVPPPVQAQRAMRAWFERAQRAGRIGPLDSTLAAVSFMGTIHARIFLSSVCGYEEALAAPLRDVVELFWSGVGCNKEEA